MNPEEIRHQLQEFFEREFPNPDAELTSDTHLLDDWLVDSFGIVNTTLFLEENFGIEVSRADINAENFQSIHALANYVAKQLVQGV